MRAPVFFFFFFNDTATTEIYTLSLHDALPISSGINDGAAALLVTGIGNKPLARILTTAVAGVDPNCMGLGPIPATKKALKRAGLTIDQIDLVELNEAFAAQTIACIRELKLDPAKVNIYGGGIALGHPLGCTGAKLLTTLVHALHRTK